MADVRLSKERLGDNPSSIRSSSTYISSRSSGGASGMTLGSSGGTGTLQGIYESELSSAYKSSIAPRHLVIQRTVGGLGSSRSRSSYSLERSAHVGALGAPSGAYASVTSTGVNAVKSSREREKKDMQDLNERFASYIEKVRFLEVQNRKLAEELEKLKARWGKETSQIKAMYEAELEEARRLLDEAEKEKARLEIKVASLEEQLVEIRQRLSEVTKENMDQKEKIDKQNQQLSDFEGEVAMLRRKLDSLEMEREKDKRLINQLQENLNRARIDLDNETLLHVDAENRRQTLEEEIEFLRQIHEQELKELAALAYRDTTAENREFWKNEMGQALREIQEVYDDKVETMKGELETFYNLKVQEFRTGATRGNIETQHAKEEVKKLRTLTTELREKLNELESKNLQLIRELEVLRREKEERERDLEQENNELKTEVAKLRAEMEAILKELQEIIDTKLGLELEIAAYRKLLEGEENRDTLTQLLNFSGGLSLGGGGGAGGGSGIGGGFGAGGGGGGAAGYGAGGAGGYSFSSSSSSAFGGGDSNLRANQLIKGEMSAKTTYQRSAKGAVAIVECSNDGKFVAIENTGRKDESLGGFKLRRNIDGQDKTDYLFSDNFVIKAGSRVKIYGQGQKPIGASPGDIEASFNNWGLGANVITKLINSNGEDRATHVQKTVYSS